MIWKARDPVRSPIDKPDTAAVVVGSVTTSEFVVLYVLFFPTAYHPQTNGLSKRKNHSGQIAASILPRSSKGYLDRWLYGT
ncbi:hypothetical protein GGR53DRAFT_499987 [Hypoxylon sp. FL1150]|nr:hypothetical protein GGR53DRAFT_499987 [Hypoxylon sp. FL1150]